LLGYTPDTLLDEVVDAFAVGDGSAVFGVVDKVIETGQDPRRFTEDLLRRLRDLVIVSAVPDAPATGLIDIAEDAAERLVAQAARFGPAEISRAADLVATGLTEMRGATAPRLLLELICARVLLPGADHSTDGVMARLDRLERRMTISGGDPSVTPVSGSEPGTVRSGPAVMEPPVVEPVRPAPPQEPAGTQEPAETQEPAAPAVPAAAAASSSEPAATTAAGSTLSLVDVRRLWPDIVEATKQRRRLTWIYLTQQAQVVAVDDQVLTLGFANAGARDSFDSGGSSEIVRQAAIDVVGHDWRVETIVDPGADPEGPPAPARAATTAPARPAGHDLGVSPTPEPGTAGAGPSQAGPSQAGSSRASARTDPAERDGGARPDDSDEDSGGVDGAELLQQALGAQVIEEIPHQ
jgi:DNA polymerase-3 subunit gamma/tau